MLMLLGLITILGIVEVGYLYSARRDAQKVADLAALSGVQQLTAPVDSCPAAASSAALGNAAANGGTAANGYSTIDISCGGQPASSSSMLAPASASSVAAIKVDVTRDVNHLFGAGFAWTGTHPVTATAVATQQSPVAAFTVSSQLLELQENGTVPGILQALGLNIDETALVGPNGVANLRITPSGLLEALCQVNSADCINVAAITDVGTLNNTLAGKQISVGDLINAMTYLGTQQGLAQTAITALNTIAIQAATTGNETIQLGTSATERGLFALIQAPNASSALNAQLSALDLLNVGLEVANSQHFVSLPVSVPGVTESLSLIEPPSIAIGGVGATAYTAQIRIQLNINTNAIPLLGTLLPGLGTQVNIPIIIDLITGQGTITALCNQSTGPNTATILTQAAVLHVCAGTFDSSIFTSTSEPCDYNLKNVTFIQALGVPISQGMLDIPALTSEGSLTLQQGETGSIYSNLNVGDATSEIISQLLSTITNGALGGLGIILTPVTGIVVTALTPVLNSVGTLVLQPLLTQLLGTIPNRVDVHLQYVQCQQAQLVY